MRPESTLVSGICRFRPHGTRNASAKVSRRAAANTKGRPMLYYAAVFFVIAIIAAVFGFGGIAVGAAEIAKVLFFVFLVLFVCSLIADLVRRRRL
jgi:uncharacterized membrane protein YtjA (UPF0391 family)